MVRTGVAYNFEDEIEELLVKLSNTFEYYLPDEKISQVWQETEVISTRYPDFEAVYFKRELEGVLIYISEEYEFFPLYVMYLISKHGHPSFMQQGAFRENDLIGIDDGSDVMVIGFTNPDAEELMLKYVPVLNNEEELNIEFLKLLAWDYIEDII